MFILISFIVGLLVYFFVHKKNQKMIQNKDEKVINAIKARNGAGKFEVTEEVLTRLANRLGGRLSVKDVITQTTITEAEAKSKLEKLLSSGKCEIKLDEVENTGVIYYYFS